MLILGIDPGYAIVGYGVLDYKNNHFTVVDYGAITTDAGNADQMTEPFEFILGGKPKQIECVLTDVKMGIDRDFLPMLHISQGVGCGLAQKANAAAGDRHTGQILHNYGTG